MKRKILSLAIMGVFAISTIPFGVKVSAAPSDQQVQQQRNEYESKKAKVNEIDQKIQGFDDEISKLTIEINDNNNKINDINKQVENTNKEIEQAKKDISNKDDILGQRLREMYKSGGEMDYLSLICSADSLGDLVTKVAAAVKVVNLDQKVLKDLSNSKNKLDEKINSLESKSNEIKNLNNDIEKQKGQVDQKLEEQKQFREQAKAEQDKFYKEFLVPIERDSVQGFMDVANNPNSNESQLNDAINALRAIKNQLKSSEVENEVNNAIETAKKTLKKIEDNKAAAAAAAATVNKGQDTPKSNGGDDPAPKNNQVTPTPTPAPAPASASAIVNYAYKFIGTPYEWGATGPSTFDCSGFTSYVYRNVAGINIGRTTYDQINAGREVSQSELQPGDLVFPHSGHVTIYVGNGQVIHAPSSGDFVKVSRMWSFWRARRIL